MRRGIAWAVAVGAAGLVHVLAGRFVAGQDVVLALLVGGRVGVALVVGALLAARLFLVLVAPGWGLYVVVRGAVGQERGGQPNRNRSEPP